jgi:hypothetical protein
MRITGSVSFSQKPATGFYPGSVESSPHIQSLFFRSILILSHPCLSLPNQLCSLGFLYKILYAYLFITPTTFYKICKDSKRAVSLQNILTVSNGLVLCTKYYFLI